MVAAEDWSALVAEIERIGTDVLEMLPNPTDPSAPARMVALLLRELGAGYLACAFHDPDHPQFVPRQNALVISPFHNPDDLIQLAPIRGDGVYRITGRRGTVHFASLQIGSGDIVPYGTGSPGPSLAEYPLESLRLDSKGAFDVLLSRTRPEGYQGDHWPLDERATYVLARQRHYDWLEEDSARLSIERLDRAPERGEPEADRLRAQMRAATTWLRTHAHLAVRHPLVRGWREAGYLNRLHTRDCDEPGRCPGLHYTRGLFELEQGQALLLEAKIPDACSYWSFHLGDELTCTLDYTNHQSTLNGHTGVVDADGTFRAVVGPDDPGVHNWLDTVGRRSGFILGRWHGCATRPAPTVRMVAVEAIADAVPTATRWVSRPEREHAIRRRMRAAQMRRKW